MRKSGYFFISACTPSVSLSAYCTMFFALIDSTGFSSAYGSGRTSPFL